MKGYNKVMLLGHLTADPECRETTTGKQVAHFTLAVDRNTPKDIEKVTDFHYIVAWSNKATYVTKFLKKGMAVFVVGKIQKHAYEGKNGKQWATEIILQEVNILTWKGREAKVADPVLDEPEVEEVDVSGEELSATILV